MCDDMTGLAIMAGRLSPKMYAFCLALAGIACDDLIAWGRVFRPLTLFGLKSSLFGPFIICRRVDKCPIP